MNDDVCLLTIGDLTALELLHEEWSVARYALAPMLRTKLDAAKVVFPDDLPADVAILGSKIAYAVGDARHVAMLTPTPVPDPAWLPITMPIGLALLGQREGWAKLVSIGPGRLRMLTLGEVIEQLGSAPSERMPADETLARTPALRVVTRPASIPIRPGMPTWDDDDPGPAAA